MKRTFSQIAHTEERGLLQASHDQQIFVAATPLALAAVNPTGYQTMNGASPPVLPLFKRPKTIHSPQVSNESSTSSSQTHSTNATVLRPCASAAAAGIGLGFVQQPHSIQNKGNPNELYEFMNQPRSLIGEVISTIQPRTDSQPASQTLGIFPPSERCGQFTSAHDFVMMQPSFYDHSRNYSYIMTGQPILLLLKNAGTPEAGLDAAARYPLPRCHPETRKTIQGRLLEWLLDKLHKHRMMWVFGPAGVGKSAVAQTFAEGAKAKGLLASAYFFSSTQGEKRSDPLRVIPTLAYQLAIHSHHYQRIITQKLASDPSILDATLEAQFRGLIEDPFLQLASYNIQPFEEKFHAVVVDGLDECRDDEAQCELVELIKGVSGKPHLPLIWLIISRPERHLKSTFSQPEYAHICGREEIVINDEARADVEQFMRARFKEIHWRYRDTITVDIGNPWPAETDFTAIMREVSGHFIVTSVAERYVSDPTVGNPEAQLSSLLSMLRGLSNANACNPLEALDAFYYRILAKVSESSLPAVMKILSLCAYNLDSVESLPGTDYYKKLRTVGLWPFLQMNRSRFYSDMQKLHSVIDISSPEEASKRGLTFYHKSFPDYLTNKRRSGKFFVSREQACQYQLACTLHWYKFILQYENRDYVTVDEYHRAKFMLRAWFRGKIREKALNKLRIQVIRNYEFYNVTKNGNFDSYLFNVLHEFNYNLILNSDFESSSDRNILPMLAIKLAQDARTSPYFVRTEVKDRVVDLELFFHLELLTDGKPIEPLDLTATNPMKVGRKSIRFVIIGNGLKSGLACIGRGFNMWAWEVIWLNAVAPPDSEQKLQYRSWRRQLAPRERTTVESGYW